MGRLCLAVVALVCGSASDGPRLTVVPAHAWRPPFGLDRVGCADDALIEWPAGTDKSTVVLEQRAGARSIVRETFPCPKVFPSRRRVRLDSRCDEVALLNAGDGKVLCTLTVEHEPLAVVAEARAEPEINPVDLGTILPPAGWLLLGPDQNATVDVALLSTGDREVQISARYASNHDRPVTAPLSLQAKRRVDGRLALPKHAMDRPRDELQVEVHDGAGATLWRSTIPVIIVADPPELPRFGATALKLRYDSPISVRDPKTGAFSSLDYGTAWDQTLDDVVVSLPNGARFVFWRGSSYIPFWAGCKNTGLCMEWAEMLNRPADAVDCVEPLMDKELRYGRVQVIESTPARVHVRWSYQSTDLNYKTWGDSAVEDYYFYPDGFGTRVLTLTADPAADYELSEFIVLTPQGRYPLDVIPDHPIDLLFPTGSKRSLSIPLNETAADALRVERDWPAVYRVRLARDDAMTAIYFHPDDVGQPPLFFGPFFEDGLQVTPAYWGSHWPLARGNATGSKIDDRIDKTPSHNSLISWAHMKPKPFSSRREVLRDAHGRTRDLVVTRWAWLIGMTDASDPEVRQFATGYGGLPTLAREGVTLVAGLAFRERRALTIDALGTEVAVDVVVQHPLVNPVFEFAGRREAPTRVLWNGREVPRNEQAWGNGVLWLNTTIQSKGQLDVHFAQPQAAAPTGGRSR